MSINQIGSPHWYQSLIFYPGHWPHLFRLCLIRLLAKPYFIRVSLTIWSLTIPTFGYLKILMKDHSATKKNLKEEILLNHEIVVSLGIYQGILSKKKEKKTILKKETMGTVFGRI
jgi:hypothetical protein